MSSNISKITITHILQGLPFLSLQKSGGQQHFYTCSYLMYFWYTELISYTVGVPVNSRVSTKIQQLLNTLKRPKRPPLKEFFVDDFEEIVEGRWTGYFSVDYIVAIIIYKCILSSFCSLFHIYFKS